MMTNSSKITYAKITIASTAFLFFTLVVILYIQKNHPKDHPPKNHLIDPSITISEEQSRFPLLIKGIQITHYDGSKPVITVSADEFKVAPRKFGMFKIKPFNEVTITNLKMEIIASERSQSYKTDLGLAATCESILNEKKASGMGVIMGAKVDGLLIRVIRKDQSSLTIQAQHAVIDMKTRQFRFINAIITNHATQTQIITNVAEWNPEVQAFKINGDYFSKSPDGEIRGKGIQVGITEGEK